MNDNNSADRLTVMSYCAELDMGRRIQALARDGGVNIKKRWGKASSSFFFFFLRTTHAAAIAIIAVCT